MNEATLADRYLDALLSGNSAAANRVIDEAVDSGMSPLCIYLDMLAPAQQRIGTLWAEMEINVAEEHLATQMTLRQIERLNRKLEPDISLGVRAIVATVEGERHGIGARMVADVLRFDGWDVDYLGESVPANDLIEFIYGRDVALVALSVTLSEHLDSASATIRAIRNATPETKILLGGIAISQDMERAEKLGADQIAGDCRGAMRAARCAVGIPDATISLERYLSFLGKRIQEHRKLRRMSQQQLADAANLDRTYVSGAERGKQNLSLGATMRIANALQISMDSLLVGLGRSLR